MASYPLLSQAPTPVEVELGCDKKSLDTFRQSLRPKNLTSTLSLNLKNPDNAVPKKITFSCNPCQENFASRSLLKRHIEPVHKTGKSCIFCPHKFTLKQTLRRHIKSKHDESEITLDSCQCFPAISRLHCTSGQNQSVSTTCSVQ